MTGGIVGNMLSAGEFPRLGILILAQQIWDWVKGLWFISCTIVKVCQVTPLDKVPINIGFYKNFFVSFTEKSWVLPTLWGIKKIKSLNRKCAMHICHWGSSAISQTFINHDPFVQKGTTIICAVPFLTLHKNRQHKQDRVRSKVWFTDKTCAITE